jgi:hypothetical protein
MRENSIHVHAGLEIAAHATCCKTRNYCAAGGGFEGTLVEGLLQRGNDKHIRRPIKQCLQLIAFNPAKWLGGIRSQLENAPRPLSKDE